MERCGLLRQWTVGACLTGLTFSTLFAVGCGGAPSADQAAGPQAPAAEVAEADEPLPTGNPADTVKAFLAAYKTGDPAKAEALLTKKALEETTKADLVVAPEGIETSNYEVGEYEIHEDGAQVFSTWTEVDEKGATKTDKIVWLLLPSEGQWKIAGMAMTVFEGEPPLILNFEDPEDMFRKQERLAQEIAAREAAKAGVVPANGATPPAAAPGTAVPVTAAVPGNPTMTPAANGATRPAAPAPGSFFPPNGAAPTAPAGSAPVKP